MSGRAVLWSKNFMKAGTANFLFACSFFLLMPTIPLYLTDVLKVDASEIGVILSTYSLGLLTIRPFSGYLVDTISRKFLFLMSVILFVLTFVGYYFAITVGFFVILRFVHGIFWGISSVSSNTVAIDIIPTSRRAEGIGFFGVTMNIAMAIGPFIAVLIYDAYGFESLISASISMGVLAVVAITFIQVPPRIKAQEKQKISLDRFILVKGIPVFFNQLFLAFGWGTIVAYAVLYGKEIGIHNAGIFFLFLASGIVLSRINSGKWVDKGYLHLVMMVAMFGISMGYVVFSLVHNPVIYCLSAFILGLGYGTLFPALQTIYNNMAPASKRGTANSTYLTSFDLGIGLGLFFGATLVEILGFNQMYLFSALLCLLAMLMYWFVSRKVYEKNKLTDK